MKIEDKIQIIMIMKRDLRARNYSYIPFFISSKIIPETSRRYSNNTLKKMIMSHPLYDDMVDQFKDAGKLINEAKFLGEMKTLISCSLNVVEYDNELDGRLMHPTDIIVSDEWCRFIYEL